MIFSACVTFTCHNGRNEGLCLHRLGYEFVVLCEKLSFPMPRTSLSNHTTVGTQFRLLQKLVTLILYVDFNIRNSKNINFWISKVKGEGIKFVGSASFFQGRTTLSGETLSGESDESFQKCENFARRIVSPDENFARQLFAQQDNQNLSI